eukprot:TRINITY_DN11460_c0_g1_i1.p1 TRINITY_DN11460_c0_g1~~TRINITY_DN11460_c0_g1_i1.p1  ORF type:complete len:948 (-),score=119.86 TRINITY_DN11460_c0_g1_i1:638-3481(-)
MPPQELPVSAPDSNAYSARACRRFASHAGVDCAEDSRLFDQTELRGLSDATFSDQRWANAMEYLQKHRLMSSRADVQELLQEGAKAFGLWWRLSDASISGLMPHVSSRAAAMDSVAASPGLLQGLAAGSREGGLDTSLQLQQMSSTRRKKCWRPWQSMNVEPKRRSEDGVLGETSRVLTVPSSTLDDMRWFKWAMIAVVIACSISYGYWLVFIKAPGLMELFRWPVFVARSAGMGVGILTGIMYLSMARRFLRCCYGFVPVDSMLLSFLDGHRDIHVFTGKALLVTGVVHGVAHLVGSVEGMSSSTPEQLNEVLFCANPSQFLVRWHLSWLQWPACPMEKPLTYLEVLYKTTTGVTGIGLVVCLLVIGFTSLPKVRATGYEVFWYSHQLALVFWPILLFVHGCNGWMGIGVPLVFWTCSIPVGLYAVDRLGRCLRYQCLFRRGVVRVVEAVVRPGKNGGPRGALVRLCINKPRHLWNLEPGMYAYLCMPDYASLQWHPFTVSSGKKDPNLEFIISATGDWTEALAKRCLDCLEQSSPLPRIAIDGPYPAPTQSALSREVLVVVGAGVGITPFLSFLATITALMEEDEDSSTRCSLKVTHFFWLTRSLDEFLFGRRHFAKIAACPLLRRRVRLHLHCTGAAAEDDAAAYIFRQAIRLQGYRDRATFQREMIREPEAAVHDISLPWCWVHGGKQDVFWLSGLAGQPSNERPTLLATGLRSGGLNLVEEEGELEERMSTAAATGRKQADIEAAEVDMTFASPDDLVPANTGFFFADGRSLGLVPRTPRPAWAAMRRSNRCSGLYNTVHESCRGSSAGSRSSSFDGSAQRQEPDPEAEHDLPAPADLHAATPVQRQQSERDARAGDRGRSTSLPLVPVALGRPDWKTELAAVAGSWPKDDVHVYVCGNDQLISNLREVCNAINANAQELRAHGETIQNSAQRFHLHYERFG